jgi:hypothetical protein
MCQMCGCDTHVWRLRQTVWVLAAMNCDGMRQAALHLCAVVSIGRLMVVGAGSGAGLLWRVQGV